jgi:hypothetical protein
MTAEMNLRALLRRELGPDFASRFPGTMPPRDAIEAIGDKANYRLWTAWAAVARGRKAIRAGEPKPGEETGGVA